MKNSSSWQPTKFEFVGGKLRGSRNSTHLHPNSRLMADLVAARYQKAFAQYTKGHLLDLGCGTVPFYAAYQPYVANNTCVDWHNSFHSDMFRDQDCDLTQPLPFCDETFDTILLSDVLEHIPNPENLWQEMARILRRDGTLLLNVPFLYWVHEEPYDFYRYTEFSLRRFAEGVGLRIEELEPFGGLPEVLADLLAKGVYRLPVVGNPLSQLFQGVVSAVRGISVGHKLSTKLGFRYPLGYFMVATKA
jgi:SAM-dependent methyltransferase